MQMAASRYAIVASESFVKIHTRSSLHDIDGKGSGLFGRFEATFFGNRIASGTKTRMHLEIPVHRLDSGNSVQDREMHNLLSSRSFPNIVAELTSATLHTEPDDYSVTGSVGVRGTTRLITGHLNISQRDGRVEIHGSKSIDVRSFGITPPKFLTFQVYPDVTITIHVIAQLET